MQNEKSRTYRFLYAVAPYCSIILFLIGWTVLSYCKGEIVASPLEVLSRLLRLCREPLAHNYIWGHIWASLRRILIALSIAIVTGIPFGILVGWNPWFSGTFGTLFEMIRPVPALAWIPLFVIWMGIGETPKIVMVFLGAFMPIVVNSYTGVRLVSPLYLDVGKIFHAKTGYQVLKNIIIPAALPVIFAGIKNAASVCWTVVLAAEMIAANAGLGFLITRGMTSFDIPLIMCCMILIGMLGVLTTLLMNFLERKLCPWNSSLEKK